MQACNHDSACAIRRKMVSGSTRRAPKDGRALLNAYSLEHLANLAHCGSSSKRHLSDIVRLLTLAVKRCGADQEWLPPDKEDMDLLLGVLEATTQIPLRSSHRSGKDFRSP